MSVERDNTFGGKTAAVIGLGNIGSQLAGHLARMSMIRRIIAVDPDTYTPENLASQEISKSEVGVPKAQAVAKRLRGIRPGLEVSAIINRVENVPWGLLRADVICGCVDSKAARAAINLIARRLGQIYVDAGIRADGLMARVDVYGAGSDAACLECAWGQKDYESLGQTYSCAGEVCDSPRSGASSALGGLAAALQSIEVAKLLEHSGDRSSTGRQIVIEAACHHLYVSVLRRNPACRFDHRVWPIEKISAMTFGELVAAGERIFTETLATITVEGKSWVTQLACRCGEQAAALRLQGRIEPGLKRCGRCGGERKPVGFAMQPRLDLAAAGQELFDTPLAALGLSIGDVVRLSSGDRESCIELAGELSGQRG